VILAVRIGFAEECFRVKSIIYLQNTGHSYGAAA